MLLQGNHLVLANLLFEHRWCALDHVTLRGNSSKTCLSDILLWIVARGIVKRITLEEASRYGGGRWMIMRLKNGVFSQQFNVLVVIHWRRLLAAEYAHIWRHCGWLSILKLYFGRILDRCWHWNVFILLRLIHGWCFSVSVFFCSLNFFFLCRRGTILGQKIISWFINSKNIICRIKIIF